MENEIIKNIKVNYMQYGWIYKKIEIKIKIIGAQRSKTWTVVNILVLQKITT